MQNFLSNITMFLNLHIIDWNNNDFIISKYFTSLRINQRKFYFFWVVLQHKIYQKDQQMHFGFMSVILLHSGHRNISTTHVAIFRVVRASIQMYL